ncbi:MAG: hypothetical protein A4E63_03433 [Syntrophorhabdus sp. PtaU1.Bin050]|nr:MAG: hypothetical protein A4E63_03433 [Syntrophorhabdus sp. PtaU1.Bin050]
MTGQAGSLARKRNSRRNAIIPQVCTHFIGAGKAYSQRAPGRERKSVPTAFGNPSSNLFKSLKQQESAENPGTHPGGTLQLAMHNPGCPVSEQSRSESS